MTNSIPPWKKIVVEALELLASESEQLEYERNVPRYDITPEILAAWTSNYHPQNQIFTTQFSDSELNCLAQFEKCFRTRVSHLPKSQGTVKSWLVTPEWKEVMREASDTLRNISA